MAVSEKQPRNLIIRKEFSVIELHKNYPPKWRSKNKKVLAALSLPNGIKHVETPLILTKYSELRVPKSFPADSITTYKQKETSFEYLPSTDAEIQFYPNFADRELFKVYSGPLFAQDEHQVAEHPTLGALKEALQKLSRSEDKLKPLTRENGATPCVILNVDRRISINLGPSEANPKGLYGNNFMNATEESVQQATTVLSPPTLTNILAFEAPPKGSGEYSFGTINDILSTAYTAFMAAKNEAKYLTKDTNKTPKVTINTGHWGTGAYGGNKTIMALLQILAAELAQVDTFVFHSFSSEFAGSFKEAESIFEKLVRSQKAPSVSSVLLEIQKMGFKWGQSDGN